MTLVKTTANLIAVLAMSCCLVPASWGQAAGQATAPAKAPAKAPATAPATAPKTAHKKKAPTAKAPSSAAAPAAKPEAKSDAKPESVVAKRDPFVPLVSDKKTGGPALPPGKAGLVIATVRVDGTVKAASGMLAVVTNPDQRTYFIREGDRLYDGDVEKIGLDGVTFKENSKDAFGKPVERLVTKRIYPSAGEQQ
jgi:Tfp pilus assembly protein PilP